MKEKKTIVVLSLGAGVQSTALALMGERGMIAKPHCAIFADTGDEPPAVHAHLAKLIPMLSFPVYTVKFGDLGADFLAALAGEKNRTSQPPFFVSVPDLSPDEIAAVLAEPEPKICDFTDATVDLKLTNLETGQEFETTNTALDDFHDAWNNWNIRRRQALRKDRGGMLWRACTRDYKIIPIRRKVRQIMREVKAKRVIQQIGISTDEREREKGSGVKFITNSHPMLELGWSRQDCERWLAAEFGLNPVKSACYYCPYRSNSGWEWMKRNDPDQFEMACKFDEAIRESQGRKVRGAGIVGNLFVWRGYAPLRTAVFTQAEAQLDFGFEQECDGMCGN